MRYLLGVVASLVGICPCFALSISAEVERGFRYFKYNSDFELHRLAYREFQERNAGRKPTIHELDEVLADLEWWYRPVSAKTAAWYGHSDDVKPVRLLQQWRKQEIEKEGRAPGYLELSFTLHDRKMQDWEYHPVRIGWASLLFPAHQRPGDLGNDKLLNSADVAVCWSRAEQAHSNCGGVDSYLNPAGHTVTVRPLDGSGMRMLTGDCSWAIVSESGAKFVRPSAGNDGKLTAPCAERVSIFVPSGKTVTVKLETGGSQSEAEINIDDQLIVGVGDSFSSGEGNPDVPAKLGWAISTDQDWAADGTSNTDYVTHGPVRKAIGDYYAAQWIDRSCHRSAYSYQVRSALHLAIANPSNAITFLGYACSGAEVNEGLFQPFQGPEYTSNKDEMAPFRRAQFSLMLNELCRKYEGDGVRRKPLEPAEEMAAIAANRYKLGGVISDKAYRCANQPPRAGFKRPIDLMYVSIGGNDVGFSRWIMASITAEGKLGAFFPILEGSDCNSHKASCRETQGRWKRLKARYGLLRDFIDTRLEFAKRSAAPVLMYTYPAPVQSANGEMCPSGNSGMTIFVNRPGAPEFVKVCLSLKQNGFATLETIAQFTEKNLNRAITELATAQSLDDGPAWQAVTGYAPKFDKRGFCASKVDELANVPVPAEPFSGCKSAFQSDQMVRALALAGRAAQETLHYPAGIGGSAKEWRPFHPVFEYRPYQQRTRLLRTMNEVYFLINQLPGATQSNKASGMLSLRDSANYGSFHPTAEAHALFADSFFVPSDAILKTPRQ